MPDFVLADAAMATKLPTKPVVSPYGYIIARDGTTYGLIHQYYHGIVLAFLAPESLKEFRPSDSYKQWRVRPGDPDEVHVPHDDLLILPEREDNSVFAFQEFEFWLARKREFDFVRISTRTFGGELNVNKPWMGASAEQVEAVRAVGQALGIRPNSTVVTESLNEMSFKALLQWLPVGEEYPWSDE